MRSLATRDFGSEISAALPDVIAACKAAGFDLIVVETSGIGQGDAAIVPHVDVPLYVMTPEFGAASQLEKIDMLDFAEFVAINKFDRKGAHDALRDVAKQVQRNKEAWTAPTERDAGVWHHGGALQRRRRDGAVPGAAAAPGGAGPAGARRRACRRWRCATAPTRRRWCRRHAPATWPRSATRCAATRRRPARQARLAREIQQLRDCGRHARRRRTPARPEPSRRRWTWPASATRTWTLRLSANCSAQWPAMQAAYAGDEYVVKIRDKEIRTALTTKSLSRHHRSARWRCRSTKTTAKS